MVCQVMSQCLSLADYEQAIIQLQQDKSDERAQEIVSALQDWKSSLLHCLPSGK